jgi:CRISPR/Cas system-associated exonuclease Cas4 (RecB family)
LAIEDFLKNKLLQGHPLLIRMLLEDLRPYLCKINSIHCQEQVLYSDKYKIAGRCDFIGEYDHLLSVVDFKGSKRSKKEEWIKDHFLQTSFYAYAYYERTGWKINQCVILMANEQGSGQEFIVKPWDYWNELKKVRQDYKEKFGI